MEPQIIQPANGSNGASSPSINPSPPVLQPPITPKPQVTAPSAAVQTVPAPQPGFIPTVSTLPITNLPDVNESSGAVVSSMPMVGTMSHNSAVIAKSGTGRGKLLFAIIGSIFFLAFIGAGVYFWYLPSGASKSYEAAIKPSYSSQAAKMTAVYQSFSRPAFASNLSTPEQDRHDFDYTYNAIKEAQTATTELRKKNALNLLPEATVLGVGKQSIDKQRAVSNYLNDSDQLLKNYQTLATYMDKFETSLTQVPPIINSINSIGTSKAPAQIIASAQNAISLDAKYNTDLATLTVPDDLKDFHNNYVNNIKQLQADLSSFVDSISTRNIAKLTQAANGADNDLKNLDNLSNTNITQKLQGSSSIKQEITKLQAEKPLN